MTKNETIQVLQSIEDRAVDFPNMTACDWVAIASAKRHLTNSIEVKEVDLLKEFDKCCEDYIFDDEWDVYIAKHFFKLGFQKAQKGE